MERERRWWIDASQGAEPDYRFTLANERTFLAWIRTSLGLLAGGVAVGELIDPSESSRGRDALALVAIAASVVLAVGGYRRWVDVQRAVRQRQALPATRLVPVVVAGVCLLAIAAFALMV